MITLMQKNKYNFQQLLVLQNLQFAVKRNKYFYKLNHKKGICIPDSIKN